MLNSLLLAAALISAAPDTSTPAPQLTLHQIEQNIVHYTNLERQRHGLPALQIDTSLMHSARRHCGWMANSQSLTHTTQSLAENIAMGQNNSQQAVRDWMNSPGHRANMLNGSYKRVGAAAYTSRSGATYWCLQLTW